MAPVNKPVITLLALLALLLGVFVVVILVKDSGSKTDSQNLGNASPDSVKQKPTSEISPVSATASSVDPPNYGFSYPPEASFDNDWFTWWTPKGGFKGQWIKYNFDKPITIYGIKILNGSHWPDFSTGKKKYGDLYYQNAILTSATLEFSDGSKVDIKLKVYDGMQTIEFPVVTTSFVKLLCTGVFPGKSWQDVCISEVRFLNK